MNLLLKRRIEQIILAGPAGNICVEAHLRDFLEQGVRGGDGTGCDRRGPQ